jgi:hypothetical protein
MSLLQNRTRKLGPTLLSLAILIVSICMLAASARAIWIRGMDRLHLYGAYRELDQRGVIDHEMLAREFGSRFAEDWFLVVSDHLIWKPSLGVDRIVVLLGLF